MFSITLKTCAILILIAIVFVNTQYVFNQDIETDMNLEFLEENLEAYADENGGSATCYSTYKECSWYNYNCYRVFPCDSNGQCEDERIRVLEYYDSC